MKYFKSYTSNFISYLILISILLLFIFFVIDEPKFTIIDHVINNHGSIFVMEFNSKRCISHSSEKQSAKQSCMLLDNHKYLAFDYYKLIFASLYLNNIPNKVLMIGLGGGMMANGLTFLFPNINLDIVEINPDMLEIAKKHFYFTPTGNTKTLIMDGIEFVKNSSQQYDLVIIDVFNSMDIPKPFLTLDFAKALKSALSPGGIIAINNILEEQYLLNASLYKKLFGQHFTLESSGNKVIITGNFKLPEKPSLPNRTLQTKMKKLNIDTDWLLSKFILY